MNRSEAEKLLSAYDIGNLQYLEKMSRGNTSSAWRIDTDRGSYILRTVSGIMKALDEYAVSEALWGTGIAAEVILTKDKTPYTVHDEYAYNLQERLNGDPVTMITEQIVFEAGKTAALMHGYLAEAKLKVHGHDRFSLGQKLSEDCFYALYRYPHARELLFEAADLAGLEAERQEAIHGDLGIWNLLEDDGKIHIIDFGECRMGNAYFDYAGLLVSIIEADRNADPAVLNRSFLDGMKEGGAEPDLSRLRGFMRLWILRGLCAVFDYPDQERMIRETLKTYECMETLMAGN